MIRDPCATVLEALKTLYKKKIAPLEDKYLLTHFGRTRIEDNEFHSLPTLLLLGPYSTGKSSFIKSLLGTSYPGMHIGPEPTTDSFFSISYGETSRIIPGTTAVTLHSSPYRALSSFGSGFLSSFKVSTLKNPLLEKLSIIDTPGILSGDKQILKRSYNFDKVSKWFIRRSDLILVFFDADKIDVSDSLRSLMASLSGHEDRVRIILNKADSVTSFELLRVYGGLLWSLGKIVNSPEPLKVYISAQESNETCEHSTLLEKSKRELFTDIESLPRDHSAFKLFSISKLVRVLISHIYVVSYLRKDLPCFCKKKHQKKVLSDLEGTFIKISKVSNMETSDFPDPILYKNVLYDISFTQFPKEKRRAIMDLTSVIMNDIPKLIEEYPETYGTYISPSNEPQPYTGVIEMRKSDDIWKIDKNEYLKYKRIFNSESKDGRIRGERAKRVFSESGLNDDKLAAIWKISDRDKKGSLSLDEFCLAMHLMRMAVSGYEIPEKTPDISVLRNNDYDKAE